MASTIPAPTPTATTTPAVIVASANSAGLSRRMSRSPRRSTRPMAMVNTMAPNTQRGRYWSGPVRKRRTRATVPAVTRGARGGRALRHDHHEAREGHGQDREELVPARPRHVEPRKSALHRPQHGHSLPREVEGRAGRHRAHHGDERAGKPRRQTAREEDDRHHRRRDDDGETVRAREIAQHLGELRERPSRVDSDAEHLAQNGDAYLEAHAGEESH